MKKDIKALAMVAGVVLFFSGAIYLQVSIFKECLDFGHSVLYCMSRK